MRILMIDNRDSFTFNLVQALRQFGAEVLVERADLLSVSRAVELAPTHVLVSPGPGHPAKSRECLALIECFLGKVPLLGVCLGHQALALVLGCSVEHAPRPIHGKASRTYHDGRGIYRGLPNPFDAGRYHSLTVAESSIADPIEITAHGTEGEVLGLRHRALRAEGVQFHPESLLTPCGPSLLANFLGLQKHAVQDLLEATP